MQLISLPGTKIVGLTGKKGAGKDTIAALLCKFFGFTRLAFADALYQEVATTFDVTVDFLGNRDTKETPLPQLALKNCTDAQFVEVGLDLATSLLSHVPEQYHAMAAPYADEDGVFFLHKLPSDIARHIPLSPRVVMQLWGTEYRRVLFADSYWRDKVKTAIVAGGPNGKFVVTDVRFPDEADLLKSMGGIIARVLRPALQKSKQALTTEQHPSEIAMDGYEVARTVVNVEGQPDAMMAEAEALAS